LFSPVESFREFKYLKRLDPLWPVSVAAADVGHPLAQNKAPTWHRLNAQAWVFMQSQINGSHRQQTTVSSEVTTCDGSAPGLPVTAATPESLAGGSLTVRYASPGVLTATSGSADPNGPLTDP